MIYLEGLVIVVFNQIINDFSDVLSHWMKQVEEERENFNETIYPEQFVRSFIFLLDQIQFFDSLWYEMHMVAKTNLLNFLKYSQHINFPKPQYYILKNESSEKEILRIAIKSLLEDSDSNDNSNAIKSEIREVKPDVLIKETHIVPTFIPNAYKAYELFIKVCQDLENAPNRYFEIGKVFLKQSISNLIKMINKIEESVIRSPPVKFEELSLMIQEYNEISTLVEKYQKNSFKGIFSYLHYQNILHHQNSILTHGQIKLKLVTLKFSSMTVNKAWQDNEEIKRMFQQVENETKALTAILTNYAKEITITNK